MFHICLTLVLLIGVCHAAPSGSVEVSGVASSELPSNRKPLISFDGGKVGVNFLGFHASAGLGGLLTGNSADGGLQAEAGTPFGQAAGAGIQGVVDENGRNAGGLYAGATAGGGVSAAAGLAGDTSASIGKTYAGASLGGIKETHITKVAPAFVAHKHFEFSSAPVIKHKEVELIEEEVQPKKTYIERTVIPKYVEKTIQVPSYVEKTIRVPTVVEKTIRVPAPPTVIEKTVEVPVQQAPLPVIDLDTRGVGKVKIVEKTKVHHHPHHHHYFRKHFLAGGGFGGYGGGYSDNNYGGQAGGQYQATFTKSANPQFFRDIFNIPISTLGAVSKLVGGIAGGTSGSVAFSKNYSANY